MEMVVVVGGLNHAWLLWYRMTEFGYSFLCTKKWRLLSESTVSIPRQRWRDSILTSRLVVVLLLTVFEALNPRAVQDICSKMFSNVTALPGNKAWQHILCDSASEKKTKFQLCCRKASVLDNWLRYSNPLDFCTAYLCKDVREFWSAFYALL